MLYFPSFSKSVPRLCHFVFSFPSASVQLSALQMSQIIGIKISYEVNLLKRAEIARFDLQELQCNIPIYIRQFVACGIAITLFTAHCPSISALPKKSTTRIPMNSYNRSRVCYFPLNWYEPYVRGVLGFYITEFVTPFPHGEGGGNRNRTGDNLRHYATELYPRSPNEELYNFMSFFVVCVRKFYDSFPSFKFFSSGFFALTFVMCRMDSEDVPIFRKS